MRRRGAIVLTMVAVAAVVLLSVTLSNRSHNPPSQQSAHSAKVTPQTSAPTKVAGAEIVRYQKRGPRLNCSHAPRSGQQPPTFTLPSTTKQYVGTLTVSFRYRTVGKLAGAVIKPGVIAPFAHPVATATIRPASRPVSSTSGRFSTATLVFRLSRLSGGGSVAYWLVLHIDHLLGCLDSKGNVVGGQITVTKVIYSLSYWTP